jgi:hypothetical protein
MDSNLELKVSLSFANNGENEMHCTDQLNMDIRKFVGILLIWTFVNIGCLNFFIKHFRLHATVFIQFLYIKLEKDSFGFEIIVLKYHFVQGRKDEITQYFEHLGKKE